MLVPGLVPALPLLVVLGFGWTATAATLNAELQLYLPSWVRARAVAVYMMTFTGAQAIASPIWGLIAQHVSLAAAVWISSALVVIGGVVGFFWNFRESGHLDGTPLTYWPEARVLEEPEPDAGPVQVMVEYVVPEENVAEWVLAMEEMRRSRARSGATRWELYRAASAPTRTWRSSPSPPGPSTCISTRSGSRPRIRQSRSVRSRTSPERARFCTCSLSMGRWRCHGRGESPTRSVG